MSGIGSTPVLGSTVPTFTISRDSTRYRVLSAVSTDPDAPSSIDEILAKVPSVKRASLLVELSTLTNGGALSRASQGHYVRLVGEQMEFRG